VEAEWTDGPGIVIRDSGHSALPTAADRHAAGIAAIAVLRMATSLGITHPARGIALRVVKNLPLSAGQGGSAASAVAGAAAVNAILGGPLETGDLLAACLSAESIVAGRHLDNIAPSLLGGIVLVRTLDPIDIVSLPIPEGLRIVLAHPAQELRTADARAVLPTEVPRATAVHQAAQVGAIVAALTTGDLRLLGRAIDDRIAEPARASLLPGFTEAKRAALGAGALGVSISGAGPTAFALCDSDATADRAARAMRNAYATHALECSVRVAHVDRRGVRVETQRE
jgi:homoserine kinase